MKTIRIVFVATAVLLFCACENKEKSSSADYPEWEYTQIKRQLQRGWNTWDTRSIMTEVYVEEKLGVRLSLVDSGGKENDEIRVGYLDADAAVVHPYDHSYDGTYAEADVSWHDINVKMRCSAEGKNLVMLLTPIGNDNKGSIKVRPGKIWEAVKIDGWQRVMPDSFELVAMYGTEVMHGKVVGENTRFVKTGDDDGFYLCSSAAPLLVYVGDAVTIDAAEALLNSRKDSFQSAERTKWGDNYEIHRAMQSVLAWDTVYDPTDDIIVTPVSRNWNMSHSEVSDVAGGYILFDWDTYFASEMLSTDNRELAYCNAIEITKSVDKCGFVPNFISTLDHISYDRSQPPVGSRVVWTIYERWGDRWFLEMLYPRLLRWNTWWTANRMVDGLLCWGTSPRNGEHFSDVKYGKKHALYESGLDNAHVYDNAEFLPERNILNYNDVGLSALYVADCQYLARIAEELGRGSEAREISNRGKKMAEAMKQMWSEDDGMFLCRNFQTGERVHEMDPTCFYPLICKVASKEQARQMIERHLLNEDEFWGEWVIPCTPRNAPAFKDNYYWRGRIWGPTNFLVFLGLKNYDFPEVRERFAAKSRNLLLKDWLKRGYVYENWNATTGQGDDVFSSDRFYHWGALMGYITLMDELTD